MKQFFYIYKIEDSKFNYYPQNFIAIYTKIFSILNVYVSELNSCFLPLIY